MRAVIAGRIEKEHRDENGKRIIDKMTLEKISLVPDEDGNFTMSEYTHLIGNWWPWTEIELLDELGKFDPEDGYIVRMPPLKSYPIRVKITDIEQGKSRPIEIDEE